MATLFTRSFLARVLFMMGRSLSAMEKVEAAGCFLPSSREMGSRRALGLVKSLMRS